MKTLRYSRRRIRQVSSSRRDKAFALRSRATFAAATAQTRLRRRELLQHRQDLVVMRLRRHLRDHMRDDAVGADDEGRVESAELFPPIHGLPQRGASSRRRLPVVDIAPVPDGDDDDQQDVISDRVDDAVVADADPEAGSSSQRACCGRTRVLSEERDGTLDALADRRIELLQRANRSGTQLDAVAHAQPRSALT
jgi:hypothetical protein